MSFAPGAPVPLVLASASPARLATLRAAGIDPTVLVSDVDEDAVLAAALAENPDLAPAQQVIVLARAKAHAVAALLTADAVNPTNSAGPAAPSQPCSLRPEVGFTPTDSPPTDSPAADSPAADTTSPTEPSLGLAPDLPTGCLVLGCDSMLELDGEVLGKPADAADAVRRITQQSGRRAVLHTGHWLIDLRHSSPANRLHPTLDPDQHPTLHPDHPGQVGAASSTVVHFAELTAAEIADYVATGEPLAVAGAFTIDGLGGPFVRGIEGDHHGVIGLSLPVLRDLLGQLNLTVPALWRSSLRPAAR